MSKKAEEKTKRCSCGKKMRRQRIETSTDNDEGWKSSDRKPILLLQGMR